jgi:catechol 2,3-dioxygenase-like lactoylglutathione lyase family enzyme
VYPSALKTKITTSRFEDSRHFYVDCLGMKVVREWREENDVGCVLALGNGEGAAFLEICEAPQPESFAGVSLQFRTDDLAAFQEALPAATAARGPVKRPWGSTYLYLTDPNGISVIVFEGEI